MKKAVYQAFAVLLFVNALIFTTSCGSNKLQETHGSESSIEIESSVPQTQETKAKESEKEPAAEPTETVIESETNVKPSQSEGKDISKKLIEYVQSKSEYNYYAVLDINGDEIPELLAAEKLTDWMDAPVNSVDRADLYVWKDNSISYEGNIWSKYTIPMQFDPVNHQIYVASGGSGASGFGIYKLNSDLTLSAHFCYSTNVSADGKGNLIWEYTIDDREVTSDELFEYQEKCSKYLEELSFTQIEHKEPETAVQLETHRLSSVEPEIEKIRKICNDIDSKKEQMRVEDGGGVTTRYFDEDGYIRMITVDPYAYSDPTMDEEIRSAKAYYFYDVVDGIERECFVSVLTENNDYYRFYLIYDPIATDPMNPDSVNRSTNCIRYIDSNGNTTNYLNYVDPADISKYGAYCQKAYMEIAWAYEGDY